jgi:hypothetical protein
MGERSRARSAATTTPGSGSFDDDRGLAMPPRDLAASAQAGTALTRRLELAGPERLAAYANGHAAHASEPGAPARTATAEGP